MEATTTTTTGQEENKKRARTEEKPSSEQVIQAFIGPSMLQWTRLKIEEQEKREKEVLDLLKDNNEEWKKLDPLDRYRVVIRTPSEKRDDLPGYKYKKTIDSESFDKLTKEEQKKEEQEYGITGHPYYDLTDLWERALNRELFQYQDYSEIPFTWKDVIKNNLNLFKMMWEDESDDKLNKRLMDLMEMHDFEIGGAVERAIREAEEEEATPKEQVD